MKGGRLADQVGILSLGNAAALVLQLLLGIFLARYWSRDAFGSYLQVTMIVATLSPILFLGIPSSLYYFLPRCPEGRRERVLAQSIVLLVGLGAVGAAGVALLAGPLASALNNADLAPAIRYHGLALLGMLPASAAHPLLVSQQRYRAATLVVSGIALADTGVTGGAVLAGATLGTLALALAGMHVAIGAGVVAFAASSAGGWQRVRHAWPPDRALLAEQLRYAVPLATSTHIGTLGRFFDRYIIGAVFAPALFAVYVVGAKQVPVVPLLLSSINVVLQQRFAVLHREARTAEILPLWQVTMRKQALLVFPLTAMLFVLADPFVTGLYSARYRDSVPIFQVYLGLLALKVATWPIVLTTAGETRTLLVGSALSLLASVAVSLALIRPLGLLGPAVGAVAGPLVAAAFYLRRTETLLGIAWRRLVPWDDLLRVAASALMAALPLALFRSSVDGLVMVSVAASAYLLVFAALAAASGVLRAGDLAFLSRWLHVMAPGPMTGRRSASGQPQAERSASPPGALPPAA